MRKLRDRRGITLTEMLCTVLIVLLLTALLVVGIRFAGKTYTESMRLSEAQELCSTLTSVISDKLRFCGTVTQDENGGLTQIFIQNVGSVEGKGDAFQIGEDGQLALGDRHLLGRPGQHGVLAAIPHQQVDHDKGLDILLVVHGEATGRRRTAGGPGGIPGDPRCKAADLILNFLFYLIASLCNFLLQRCFKFRAICINFLINRIINLAHNFTNQA